MFIKVYNYGYNIHDEQFCKGLFLILLSDKDKPLGKDNFRGIVRYTYLSQFGNFMMGRAWIKNKRMILSGAYGSDGLTCNVDNEIYNEGVDLPESLYEAWSHGGGWNSAGSEANLMKQWALENLDKLYKVRKHE